MQRLEARLPSIKGRRFYGVFRLLADGEEYFAGVERASEDLPERLGLEVGTIPGGLDVRRKLLGWENVIAAGKLSEIAGEPERSYDQDTSRPEIEYDRNRTELRQPLPVRSRGPRDTVRPRDP